MKVLFGAIVVDGRGKIGGHVMSKNRAGAFMRTKVTPINRKSSFQTGVRSRLAAISSAFKSLGASVITSWNAAVADFQHTNIFGHKIHPSGAQLYQKLNNNLLLVGASQITTPPLPVAVGNCGVISLTGAKGTPTLSLTLSTVPVTGETVAVYATAGLSAGKNFVKSEYRFIGTITHSDTSPKDLLSVYVAKFGAMPAAGKKIYVKVKNINNTTGQAGSPLTTSCVVAS
jgi:hypothetical protein